MKPYLITAVVFATLSFPAWAAEPPAQDRGQAPDARRAKIEACRADPQKCREEAKARFEQRFRKADADGNGMLSRDEARKGMRKLAGHFDEIDANHDGQIARDEIQAAHKARAEKRRQLREERRQQREQQRGAPGDRRL